MDAYNGVYEIAHTDDNVGADNCLVIETLQNLEPIIERAKALSQLEPGKDFRHAAIVPQIVLDRAFREGWFNDENAWKRWANDPDNALFRTWPGRL